MSRCRQRRGLAQSRETMRGTASTAVTRAGGIRDKLPQACQAGFACAPPIVLPVAARAVRVASRGGVKFLSMDDYSTLTAIKLASPVCKR